MGAVASRLGLAALTLTVGGSLALAASAVRVYTLPLVVVPTQTDDWSWLAVAALSNEQGGQSDQTSQNVRIDPSGTAQDLSRAQVVALVQRRYRARVVRTTLQQDQSGRRLYVFRLLSPGGRVWTVRIDAHSGAEIP